MSYEEMSDLDINILIAEMFGIYWHISPGRSKSGGWEYCNNHDICSKNAGALTMPLPDYCNNPSDAWPIILDSKITVRPWNHDEWQSFTMEGCDSDFVAWHENPLRAAMIVFLMMNEQ